MTKPLISFSILLLSIGFTFFYGLPAYNLSQQRRADIVSLTEILSNSEKISALLKETRASLDGIDAAGLARFEAFLPSKIDPIRFANNLQYIGRKNKVLLSSITVAQTASSKGNSTTGGSGVPQAVVNTLSLDAKMNQAEGIIGSQNLATAGATFSTSGFAKTESTFVFSGSYETFQQFLGDIEKSLGLMNVTSLTFTPAAVDPSAKKASAGSAPVYQYNMKIETYSLN